MSKPSCLSQKSVSARFAPFLLQEKLRHIIGRNHYPGKERYFLMLTEAVETSAHIMFLHYFPFPLKVNNVNCTLEANFTSTELPQQSIFVVPWEARNSVYILCNYFQLVTLCSIILIRISTAYASG